ncbi:hypothetical protein ACICHK_41395 (plasmid) [Streptomyces sp. AHU1]|uniref:hypothetical protein n=1 Tax=Streptomyces sp. AHU1 TaxID=3377215 RepID=UPI003877C3F9
MLHPHPAQGMQAAGKCATVQTPPVLPTGLPVAEAVDAIVAALSAEARLVKPGRDAPLDIER